ncbi:g8642 [Coccomyxa elongata]
MHERGFVGENLGVLTLAGGSKVFATLDAELPERLSRVKEGRESRHTRLGGWTLSSGSSKRCTSGSGRRSSVGCFADKGRTLPYLATGDWSSWADNTYDVVLSSGFLAFASHSGFLKAIDSAGLAVGGVMGTSAGALTGSLYSAGYSPEQVARELSRVAPINLLRPSCRPWIGGAISLNAVVNRLSELLPPRFEDLEKEFAVGVVSADGRYRLIDSGPLPEAVAASAAIPYIFEPLQIPGQEDGPFKDGGLVDRTGLSAWRKRRSLRGKGVPPALIHLIQRSSNFSGNDDVEATGERRITVVRSPKSGVNFFSLGDFDLQFEAAYQRATPAMRQVVQRSRERGLQPHVDGLAKLPPHMQRGNVAAL